MRFCPLETVISSMSSFMAAMRVANAPSSSPVPSGRCFFLHPPPYPRSRYPPPPYHPLAFLFDISKCLCEEVVLCRVAWTTRVRDWTDESFRLGRVARTDHVDNVVRLIGLVGGKTLIPRFGLRQEGAMGTETFFSVFARMSDCPLLVKVHRAVVRIQGLQRVILLIRKGDFCTTTCSLRH